MVEEVDYLYIDNRTSGNSIQNPEDNDTSMFNELDKDSVTINNIETESKLDKINNFNYNLMKSTFRITLVETTNNPDSRNILNTGNQNIILFNVQI